MYAYLKHYFLGIFWGNLYFRSACFWFRFSATKSIVIRALGFFGPYRDLVENLFAEFGSSNMDVTIKIEESVLNRDHDYLFENNRNELEQFMPPTTVAIDMNGKNGSAGRIFRIELPTPCFIERGVIVDIKFQFEVISIFHESTMALKILHQFFIPKGQDNLRFYKLPENRPRLQVIQERNAGVGFTFYPTSSSQLPSIYFDLMDEVESAGAIYYNGDQAQIFRFPRQQNREVSEVEDSVLGYREGSLLDCLRESFNTVCTIS